MSKGSQLTRSKKAWAINKSYLYFKWPAVKFICFLTWFNLVLFVYQSC